jgi:hypothetical protein
MSWLYIILAWAFGIISPFILLEAVEFIDEIRRDLASKKWKRDNHGKWLIHSHAGGGSDYSNGGRYTIYRQGYEWDGKEYRREWVRHEPPMKTEAEALAECARLNASPTPVSGRGEG